MIGKGKWRHAATAVALTAVAALAAGCSASGGSGADSIAGSLPTNYGPAEQTTLNVGVVPAMDSAGFFVALNEGLFTREGLKINYSPATSSETAIQQQVKGQLQITAGNYVSYVEYAADPANAKNPLEVVSEGSVMQQGAQTLFVMPKLPHHPAVPAQGQADRGERAAQHRLPARRLGAQGERHRPERREVPHRQGQGVRRSPAGPSRSPTWRQDLASGELAAAIMPEPFASIAEQQFGAVPLADLNQGATSDFPIEGYVVTKAWADGQPEHAPAVPGRALGRPGDRGHRPLRR